MDQKEQEPMYIISIAAKMVGVQTNTLRYYEKIGIIEPSRARGRIRLYSEKDIIYLRKVKKLMEELGVNLAGAEVILRMVQRISVLQHQVEELEMEIARFKGGEGSWKQG